uniref:DUF5641 domain-containing protein n=1 Tax=Trichuris muris TaxID=70415 RepID=A0A5S6QFF5_TRIMR
MACFTTFNCICRIKSVSKPKDSNMQSSGKHIMANVIQLNNELWPISHGNVTLAELPAVDPGTPLMQKRRRRVHRKTERHYWKWLARWRCNDGHLRQLNSTGADFQESISNSDRRLLPDGQLLREPSKESPTPSTNTPICCSDSCASKAK